MSFLSIAMLFVWYRTSEVNSWLVQHDMSRSLTLVQEGNKGFFVIDIAYGRAAFSHDVAQYAQF